MDQNVYQSPLKTRYASNEMLNLFSEKFKSETWRQLWVYLVEGQNKYGLSINKNIIKKMKNNVTNINFDRILHYEKKFRHDVMAHIYAYGEVIPEAKGVIHLGATSAYVVDNTNLIQMKLALNIIKEKIILLMKLLKQKVISYKDLQTVGYTHFQPAQITTVGKRFSLYLQELLLDLNDINYLIETMPFRGIKGSTGTQLGFLELFTKNNFDRKKASKKVQKLDEYITKKCGFNKKNLLIITGQTATRKIDYNVVSFLSKLAQTMSKISTDIRLLQNKKELEEPFEKNQIGSSAMPYKRNPMMCERVASLSRFVMALPNTFSYTASTQWLERTLDDSANHRISMPESFLATEGMLHLMLKIIKNLKVYPNMIKRNLDKELPFIILENLMLYSVKKHNKDRQMLHEKIRNISMDLYDKINNKNLSFNIINIKEKIIKELDLTSNEFDYIIKEKNLIGRSVDQINLFLKQINKVL